MPTGAGDSSWARGVDRRGLEAELDAETFGADAVDELLNGVWRVQLPREIPSSQCLQHLFVDGQRRSWLVVPLSLYQFPYPPPRRNEKPPWRQSSPGHSSSGMRLAVASRCYIVAPDFLPLSRLFGEGFWRSVSRQERVTHERYKTRLCFSRCFLPWRPPATRSTLVFGIARYCHHTRLVSPHSQSWYGCRCMPLRSSVLPSR